MKQGIQGTVWLDPEHTRPVAGAVVTGKNTESPFNSIHAVADAAGEFILEAPVGDVSYAVLARDSEKGLVSLEHPAIFVAPGESTEGVNLVLEAGGSISGRVYGESFAYFPRVVSGVQRANQLQDRVRDSIQQKREQPLAGVRMLLKGTGDVQIEDTVTTDANGQYLFDGLPPTMYTVIVERPPEAVVDREETDRPVGLMYPDKMHADGIDFSFRIDGLSITGKVSDASGRPLAGVKIEVETRWEKEPGAGTPDICGTTSTSSDETGSYRVDGLRRMSLEDARLFDSYSIAAVVHQVRASMPSYETSVILVPAITEDLVQSVDAISISAEQLGLGASGDRRPGTMPHVRGNVISGVDFVLRQGAAISGTLVTRRGAPVTEHALFLQPETYSPSGEPKAMTDKSGRFSLQGLPPGTYSFYCYAPEPMSDAMPLFADNGPITLAGGDEIVDYVVTIEGSEDRGDIVGHVVDGRTKRPLDQFTVAVLSCEALEANSGRQRGQVVQMDSEKGGFTIRHVSPGNVTIRVDAPDYGPAIHKVEVRSGKMVETTVLMREGGSIEGYAMVEGQPSWEAVIRVYAEEEQPYLEQVTPDETGYYRLGPLGEGTYMVVAEFEVPPQPTKRRSAQWVTVHANNATRADFDVEGTAALSGNLWLPLSHEYAHVAVQETKWRDVPLDINDWPAFKNQVMAHAFLRGGGAYRIDALPPGDFIVTGIGFNKSESRPVRNVDVRELSREVHIESGEAAIVDLDLR